LAPPSPCLFSSAAATKPHLLFILAASALLVFLARLTDSVNVPDDER